MSFDACGEEKVQVTRAVQTDGLPVRIFKNSGGTSQIIEISMQPHADCDLQLFEGNGTSNPITASRSVAGFLLWSTPAKNYVQDDIFLVIQQGNVVVDVDVRYIPRKN